MIQFNDMLISDENETTEQIVNQYFIFPFQKNANEGQETFIEAKFVGFFDDGKALFTDVKKFDVTIPQEGQCEVSNVAVPAHEEKSDLDYDVQMQMSKDDDGQQQLSLDMKYLNLFNVDDVTSDNHRIALGLVEQAVGEDLVKSGLDNIEKY